MCLRRKRKDRGTITCLVQMDFSQPRKLNVQMTLIDEVSNLNFKPDSRDISRFDHGEANSIQFETCEKGIRGRGLKRPCRYIIL